jgi:hypothetical protein
LLRHRFFIWIVGLSGLIVELILVSIYWSLSHTAWSKVDPRRFTTGFRIVPLGAPVAVLPVLLYIACRSIPTRSRGLLPSIGQAVLLLLPLADEQYRSEAAGDLFSVVAILASIPAGFRSVTFVPFLSIVAASYFSHSPPALPAIIAGMSLSRKLIPRPYGTDRRTYRPELYAYRASQVVLGAAVPLYASIAVRRIDEWWRPSSSRGTQEMLFLAGQHNGELLVVYVTAVFTAILWGERGGIGFEDGILMYAAVLVLVLPSLEQYNSVLRPPEAAASRLMQIKTALIIAAAHRCAAPLASIEKQVWPQRD